MAKWPQFVGGSYQAEILQASAERSLNWYPVKNESPGAKAPFGLRSKPGLAVFAQPAGMSSIRAECALNNRGFFVAQAGAANYFYELNANGTATSYGAIAGDRRPQLSASQSQILVLSGGLGWCFDLRTSTLSLITDPNFPIGATKAGFLDAYHLVLEPNSQVFATSGLNDVTTWNALDFGDVEGEPGNVVTFEVDHRQIWFLCNNHTEIYYDSGAAAFPIVRLEGAFMEQGSECIDGAFKCDNTLFWLGGNRDGAGVVWRAAGYTPQRVSTHAIEKLIQGFGDLSDASGYAYQESGHTVARWDFPSAHDGLGASVLYDLASGYWHERCFWHARLGLELADLARTHMFVWGKHLVGDYRSGTIYEQSQKYHSDAGAQIRRVRTSPDLANGGKWTRYSELRLLCDVGVGLDGASAAVIFLFTAALIVDWLHGWNSLAFFPVVWDAFGALLGYGNLQLTGLNNVELSFALPQSGALALIPAAYSQTFAAAVTVAIPHNLATLNILPVFYDAAYNVIEPASFTLNDANTATALFGVPQTGSLCLIVGGYSQAFVAAMSVTVAHFLNSTRTAACVYDAGNTLVALGDWTPAAPADGNNSLLTFATPQTGRVVAATP